MIGKENLHPLMNMDISELKNGYEIHTDLPGVLQDDIKIKVKDGVLSITASRCKETNEECQNQESKEISKEKGEPSKTFHRKERFVGEFSRREVFHYYFPN
jgi:HSP20 family molecular chaperone IbpA